MHPLTIAGLLFNCVLILINRYVNTCQTGCTSPA